jgi:hypothetical protein
MATDDEIESTLLKHLAARGPGRTLDPQEVARALGGAHPDGWGPMMQPVRRAAVRLMKQGRVVITRRGRPVDPDDFKGTYRIVLPEDSRPVASSPMPEEDS